MKLSDVIQRGTRASQPVATTVPSGTLYFVTDEGVTERSTALAWESFSGTTITLTDTTSLTDAQIKALPTTSITLISAPGSGFRIKIHTITVRSTTTSGAYTNINTTSATLVVDTSTGTWLSTALMNDSGASLTKLSDILGVAGSRMVDLANTYMESGGGWVFHVPSGATHSDFENKAIRVTVDNNGSGNFTGGHASNALKITITYTIEAI